MKWRVCLGVGCLVWGLAAGSLVAHADEPETEPSLIPGTDSPLHELVSGLPMPFVVEMADTSPAETDAAPYLDGTADDAPIVRTLRSEQPVSEGPGGPVYLRIKLTSEEFESSADARSGFDRLLKTADPDMGLSYAWDYVLAQGTHLYRLHAGCLLSEDRFKQVVARLDAGIAVPDGTTGPSAICRCGGGCVIVSD